MSEESITLLWIMTQCRKKQVNYFCAKIGVAEWHHVNADPDPVSGFPFITDSDSVSAFHFNADPDPGLDPAPHCSDANLRPLVYCTVRPGLHIKPSSLHCERPRLHVVTPKLLNLDSNADPDSVFHMRIRIHLQIIMRIRIRNPGRKKINPMIALGGQGVCWEEQDVLHEPVRPLPHPVLQGPDDVRPPVRGHRIRQRDRGRHLCRGPGPRRPQGKGGYEWSKNFITPNNISSRKKMSNNFCWFKERVHKIWNLLNHKFCWDTLISWSKLREMLTASFPNNFAWTFSSEKFNVVDPHHVDADADPTFHSDADLDLTFQFDPDPDPTTLTLFPDLDPLML